MQDLLRRALGFYGLANSQLNLTFDACFGRLVKMNTKSFMSTQVLMNINSKAGQECVLPLFSTQNGLQLHHKEKGNSIVQIAPYSKNACESSWLRCLGGVNKVLITR
jgi:hypothetical protein